VLLVPVIYEKIHYAALAGFMPLKIVLHFVRLLFHSEIYTIPIKSLESCIDSL